LQAIWSKIWNGCIESFEMGLINRKPCDDWRSRKEELRGRPGR